MPQPSLELAGYRLCPFVQRAVIMACHKGLPVRITWIEPGEHPDWFAALSPTGKVPLLVVDQTPVFESAVICEYLDEISPPSVHPADALQRATHRAWVEFASSLLMDLFQLLRAPGEAEFDRRLAGFGDALERLEQALEDQGDSDPETAHRGPLWSGQTPCMVDFAVAPLLMRLSLLEPHLTLMDPRRHPRLRQWAVALAALPAVKESIPENFLEHFREHTSELSGHAGRFLPSPMAVDHADLS